jgi:hypothetical protein
MKYIFVFLVYLSFVCSANAQKKTDVEKQKLIGAVKSISSKMISYADENEQNPVRTVQRDLIGYDKKGNEIERIIYDDYSFLVGKNINTYDEKGNLSESVLTDGKNKILEKNVREYEQGNLIQTVTFDGKGRAQLKQINSFDNKGYITAETYFVSTKPIGKTVYKYDSNYNLIETAFFTADGSKAFAPIGPCLSSHKLVYSYSGKHPAQIVAYEPDGKIKVSWKYSYDKNERLTELVKESDYSVLKFQYSYEDDSKGNWIKQSSVGTSLSKSDIFKSGKFLSSKRITVISREITYY